MPTFQYKAKTQAGEFVTGSLAAGDRRTALAQLGRLGYYPITVSATGDGDQTRKRDISFGSDRVTSRDVMLFTRQLSSLLRSGLSLSKVLESQARRAQKKSMRSLLEQLHNDIVQGESLSGSLAKHPKLFSKFYVNLVKAGEASGALEEVLLRLLKYSEQVASLKEKVVTALIYPTLIVLVGIATIIFAMTVMVPKFAMMFEQMGRVMPLPTRILIGVSNIVTSYWWIVALIIVALVIIYRWRARTAEGRIAIDNLKLKLPLLGTVTQTAAFAQFARTLATLLENGVPVLNSLQIVEDTMTNSLIANELRQARTRVTDGTSISDPLAKGKIFPPLLIDMLAVGEESGEVVPALKNIAETYEQELAHHLKVLTTLLEPIIIILMAIVVGSIVVSILLAVFDLTSGIGG